MIKHLLMSAMMGLVLTGHMAYAEISVMNNGELAATVVESQPDQLQPVLPDQKVNGQIGGVVVAIQPQTVPVASSQNVGLGVPSPAPHQIDLPFTAAQVIDALAYLQLRNTPQPQNIGR